MALPSLLDAEYRSTRLGLETGSSMGSRWWQAVLAVAILQAILFVVIAVVDDLGILGQSVILLVAAGLTARGWIAGVVVIGVFCLVEVVFVPFYDRETAFDWVAQSSAWILSLLGLVAVGGVLLERRRRPAGNASRQAEGLE